MDWFNANPCLTEDEAEAREGKRLSFFLKSQRLHGYNLSVMTKRSLDGLTSKLVLRLTGMQAAFMGGQSDELNRSESQPRGWWLSSSTRGLAVSTFLWQAGFLLCQNLGLWHNGAGLQVGPGFHFSSCPNQSPSPVWPLLLVLFASTERTELV